MKKFRLNIEERKAIQDFLDQGKEIKYIAEILHRSQSCISSEIKRNGGIRIYDAKKAQENSITNAINGNKDKNSPLQHLKKRVEFLEKCIRLLIPEERLEILAEESGKD